MLMYNNRFDIKTTTMVLLTYLDGVQPVGANGVHDAQTCIHQWEAKMKVLRGRHLEEISDKIQHAVFVAMMGKVFQDTTWEKIGAQRRETHTRRCGMTRWRRR